MPSQSQRNSKMDLKTIRIIDTYIGEPLCYLANIHNKIKQNFIKNKSEVKNILIIKMWGIGSIILASPTIKQIRKKYPKAHISFLTLSDNKGVYEGNPLINEIIYFKLGNILQVTKDFLKLIYKLRKKNIDLVIDLEPFARFSEIVSYLTNAKTRIGFYIENVKKGRLYNIKVSLNDKQHITKFYLDLLKPFNINIKNYKIEKIHIQKEDEIYIKNILKNINKKFICINIAGSDFAIARRWPKENFIKLVDKMNEKYKDLHFIFIGLGKDISLINNTMELMKSKNVTNLAGKTNIKQLAALFKESRLVITNDSGPLHVAVAMNTPTVSFFGPETPVLYGPLSKKHTIFYKNLDCSPCIRLLTAKQVKCQTNDAECLRRISVEEVFNSLKKYL